jgi:hypothetical protein
MTDRAIIARIIELVPLYDHERMPDMPSTLPDSELGYSFINFCIDTLQEEFPAIDQEQFNRCYGQALFEPDQWQRPSRLS